MKQSLFWFLLLITTTVFSQNAIAELKFEEAETAFNNSDYALTIQKVDEFEHTLGGITDKSLYLRVVSQSKLLDPAIFYADEKQFELYNSLMQNATKYIKATEKNGLNDKFKEVYSISENLKKLKLPNNKIAWQEEKQRIEKAHLAQLEETKLLEKLSKEIAPKIDGWEWQAYVKTGENFNELKRKYPENYDNLHKLKIQINSAPFTLYYDPTVPYGKSPLFDMILAENGIITNYSIFLGKFTDEAQVQEFMSRELSKLKDFFGEKAIKKTIEEGPKKTPVNFSSAESVFEMNRDVFINKKECYIIASDSAKSSISLIVEKMTFGWWVVRSEKNLIKK